jgi:hypothetical protein
MPGSIRRCGDRWTVTVDLGRDPGTGKRRQVFRSVRTKRDAEALLVELLHERDTGIERPVGKVTVAHFLERWLTDHVAANVAPRTAADYVRTVRRTLIPALGSVELTAFGQRRYRRSIASCCARGASTRWAGSHRVPSESSTRLYIRRWLTPSAGD